MNKKVMFIVYYFPPLAGSGVQRSLKFIKYLPKYNIEPVVVTVKEGHNFAYDPEMIKEVSSDIKVYRSNSGETLWLRKKIEAFNKILLKIKNISGKKSLDHKGLTRNENIKGLVNSKETIKDKIFRYLEYNYYVPDTKIRWYKNAINDINKRVLQKEEVDIIFSTSAPYTDHLIALEIKKKINKPWIADFRDPWVGNKFIYGRYNEKRKSKERNLEREVVTYADKIINVTECITEMYKKRYPEFSEKFVTITNGFDIEDKVVEPQESDKFVINYSGIVVDGQSPDMIIKAIEEISEEQPKFKEDLIINFTGHIHDKYKHLFKNTKLKENIKINGYIPHSEVLKEMNSAAINLVILPDKEESKGIYTGKIFDYILSERPILGVMPLGGVAATLINSKRIGKAVDYSDIDSTKRYIEKIYLLWKDKSDLNTNAIEICKEFDRRNLTRCLVDLINNISN